MKSAEGYPDQLDRARRFLARVEAVGARRDVDYQDDVWAFFQNCWHIKDWLQHDATVLEATKQRLYTAIHASSLLKVCQDMANGTKHLLRNDPNIIAAHSHTNMTITPGAETTLDCLIQVNGGLVSARKIARECVDEWVRLLTAENLATGQRS